MHEMYVFVCVLLWMVPYFQLSYLTHQSCHLLMFLTFGVGVLSIFFFRLHCIWMFHDVLLLTVWPWNLGNFFSGQLCDTTDESSAAELWPGMVTTETWLLTTYIYYSKKDNIFFFLFFLSTITHHENHMQFFIFC